MNCNFLYHCNLNVVHIIKRFRSTANSYFSIELFGNLSCFFVKSLFCICRTLDMLLCIDYGSDEGYLMY